MLLESVTVTEKIICNYITVTYENVSDYKGGYIWIIIVLILAILLCECYYVIM